MEAILSYALSFSDFVGSMVDWGIAHPAAGVFYATLVADLVTKFFPQGGFGHGFIGIFMNAVLNATRKAFERKGNA